MLRATLTLLAGGALAQALPLLLGPLLTRLYSPEEFGAFHLFSAVAVNLSVVACARYEFALPMVRHEQEARDLLRLSRRILIVTTLLWHSRQSPGWAWPGRCRWRRWKPRADRPSSRWRSHGSSSTQERRRCRRWLDCGSTPGPWVSWCRLP